MAIGNSELINVEVLRPEPEPEVENLPIPKTYTGLAVLQGDRWVAIAPELGTVAEGSTASEALGNLEAAVQDVLEIAHEEDLPWAQPVGRDELAELIIEHRRQSSAPVTMRTLIVQA